MSVRVDHLLPDVAAELGLTFVETLGGGEFGAALVRRGGDELVLKVHPDPTWAPIWTRGARLSALVAQRSPNHPIPRYDGTGVVAGVTWSLQARLPGEIPDVLTAAHAEQLLDLVTTHADVCADEPDPDGVDRRFDREVDGALERLRANDLTRSLADEIERALDGDPTGTRGTDVVHGDFHHRNFLADRDGRVTGVFDWELAWVGDWRIDLVALACWSSWASHQFEAEATDLITRTAEASCPPALLARFAAHRTLLAVDFDLRVHPDWLPALLAAIDAGTRRWL